MTAQTSAHAEARTALTADQPEKVGSTAKAEMTAVEVLSMTVGKVAEAQPVEVTKEANAALSITVMTGAVSAVVQTVRLSALAEKITVQPVVEIVAKVVSPLTAMTVVSTAAAMTAEKEALAEKSVALTGVVTAARTGSTVQMTAAEMHRAKTGRFPESGTKTALSVRPAGKRAEALTAVLHVKTVAARIVLLSRDVMTVQSVATAALSAVTVAAKASKKAALVVQTKKPRRHLSIT